MLQRGATAAQLILATVPCYVQRITALKAINNIVYYLFDVVCRKFSHRETTFRGGLCFAPFDS